MSRMMGNSVARVTESYRALYLENESNDKLADEALRQGLLKSFQKHDTLVSELWTEGGHKDVFSYGVELGVEELQKDKITEEQRQEIHQRLDKFLKDIEIFTGSDTEFYKEVYSQYEKKYDGETVDFHADMARYNRSIENQEVPDMYPESEPFEELKHMTQAELEEHVAKHTDELFDNYIEQEKQAKTSGLSYSKASLDVIQAKDKQQVRTYETKAERQSRIKHERISEEMRRHEAGGISKEAKQHHEHARKHNPNQHFSHADGYGIEETEIHVKPKVQPKPKVKDDDLELG